MSTDPALPYVSYDALDKHRQYVGEALERTRQVLDEVPGSAMHCVPVRVDDLRYLLCHLETLKSDVVEAQRAALLEAAETIETIGALTAALSWQSCAFMIRNMMPPSPREQVAAAPPRRRRKTKRSPKRKPAPE